jgi:hypothetical protein
MLVGSGCLRADYETTFEEQVLLGCGGWRMRWFWMALFIVSVLGIQPVYGQGYLEWEFGMPPAAVSGVEAYAPYTPIGDGDLETANGQFDGEVSHVSFHFAEGSLDKVQVWLYQGRNQAEALKQWARAEAHIRQKYGSTESPTLGMASIDSSDELLSKASLGLSEVPDAEMARLQLGPIVMPEDVIVFSSLIRHPEHGFYVNLYYRRPLPVVH